jgi:hypothetical protein
MIIPFAMLVMPLQTCGYVSSVLSFVKPTTSFPCLFRNCRLYGKRHQGQIDDDIDLDYLRVLEEAGERDKENFQLLINQKLEEWREMKKLGILDKLSSGGVVYLEDVLEAEEMSSKLLKGRKKKAPSLFTSTTIVDSTNNTIVFQQAKAPRLNFTSFQDLSSETSEKIEDEWKRKIQAVKKDGLGLYNIYNEMKDKKVPSTPLVQQELLRQLAKVGTKKHLKAVLLAYLSCLPVILQEASVQHTEQREFLLEVLLSSAASNSEETARECQATLLQSNEELLSQLSITDRHMRIVSLCLSIRKLTKEDSEEFQELFREFLTDLHTFNIENINIVLRLLGKQRRIQEIFSLCAAMRLQKVRMNSESHEFLAAALVKSVEKGKVATAMKELPVVDGNLPEVT